MILKLLNVEGNRYVTEREEELTLLSYLSQQHLRLHRWADAVRYRLDVVIPGTHTV